MGRLFGSAPVDLQVLCRHLVWLDKAIVLFVDEGYAVYTDFKTKESNNSILYELRGNGSTNKVGELVGAYGEILLDLDDAELVGPTLSLHRENVLHAPTVNAYVNLISLDLTHFGHRGAQMVLEGVAGDASENVDEPVVTHDGKKRLFVIERIRADEFGRRIRDRGRIPSRGWVSGVTTLM